MMFNYMDELIKEGKLQYTDQFPDRVERKKYVTTGSGFNIFSEQSLLEFCMTPRRSNEIFRHFGMTGKKLFPYLDEFIKAGKLKITSITNLTAHRKYMTVT